MYDVEVLTSGAEPLSNQRRDGRNERVRDRFQPGLTRERVVSHPRDQRVRVAAALAVARRILRHRRGNAGPHGLGDMKDAHGVRLTARSARGHAGRDPNREMSRWDVDQHDRVGSHDTSVADGDSAQNSATRAQGDVVAHYGRVQPAVGHAATHSHRPESDPLLDGTVLADDDVWSQYDAGRMVERHTGSEEACQARSAPVMMWFSCLTT